MRKTYFKKINVLGIVLYTLFIQYLSQGQIYAKENENMQDQNAIDVVITVIYDNNSSGKNLKTGWGFACLVQGTEKTILFDTGGDGFLLMKNLQKLTIDPEIIDIVFLSHIHEDHTGGLHSILRVNTEAVVYTLKSFPKHFTDDIKEYGAKLESKYLHNAIRTCIAINLFISKKIDNRLLTTTIYQNIGKITTQALANNTATKSQQKMAMTYFKYLYHKLDTDTNLGITR